MDAEKGMNMVIHRFDDKIYATEEISFFEKCKEKKPSCCVCGTTENVYFDGPWYGYRCTSNECGVF